MSLGERITELRKAQNLGQTELAQAMGVSRQAVSKWESDKTYPDTLKLIQLSEVLNTEVEYLATGRKPVYQSPPINVTLVKKVDKVVEKVVEKPVERVVLKPVEHIVEKPVIRYLPRTRYRYRYRRNPLELLAAGCVGIGIGILIGFLL